MGHPVVSHEEWLMAREAFLAREKQFSKLRDELARARRDLPWEKVEKPYLFDGPNGPETLEDLFAGRSQLVVYHFMFAPEWEQGCPHCSFWADNFNPNVVHLAARDVSLVAVSRAPRAKLDAFQQRMGWTFKWLSSGVTDFNYDFQVSWTAEQIAAKSSVYNYRQTDADDTDREGVSVFFRDASGIYHTYSAYARGIDLLNSAYNFLDICPKGRDEAGIGPGWVRHHDRYGEGT
jgi:predicted dithiol-disulfide oxidoreductase (DUF899 family)